MPSGPTFVPGQQGASSTSGNNITVTLAGVTPGNTLVAAVGTDDNTLPGATAITDTNGDTWGLMKAEAGATAGRGSTALYRARNVVGGSTPIKFTHVNSFIGLSVAEYTPDDPVLDGTNGANSSSTGTPSGGNLVTTNADDLLLASACNDVANTTWSAGASWNLRGNVTSATNTTVALQDRTVSATGTYSTAYGNSSTSGWAVAAAAIKAAVVAVAQFVFRPLVAYGPAIPD